jgi:hypothetical protein
MCSATVFRKHTWILAALKESFRIMSKIDHVIEEHGAWSS